MTQTPIVFLDTETTGLHPDRRAWEIAMIRRDDAGERETLIQVADVDLSTAEPKGLQIGGFYERHQQFRPQPRGPEDDSPADLMTEQQCAWHIERFTRGAHIVGAVPDFDARTLDPMLRRHGHIPAWHYHLVDVEAMAVGWLAGQGHTWVSPPWRSDELSRACHVDPPNDEDRHTAMGDARWVMRWYDAMTSGAS